MIRKSLANTKAATFSILIPNENQNGIPTPFGTGFFVSPDGWFITAAHVVTKNGKSDGAPRDDIDKAMIEKERDPKGNVLLHPMCHFISLEYIDPKHDIALLKVDFEKNKDKYWLKDETSFPHLTISKRLLDDGEPVYSFGYPLSYSTLLSQGAMTMSSTSLCPRVTSAIVSSNIEQTKFFATQKDTMVYVLDKALNYGNSGGPIIATDTGRVHAFCSSFQPVFVPQPNIKDNKGNDLQIMIPSLYGVVISLHNIPLLKKFEEFNIANDDT